MTDNQARTILLHRRLCTIRPGRIDVHPARTAVMVPLVGVIVGVACFVLIVLGLGSLPLPVLLLLLLVSLTVLPLSAMGLVFSVAGAHVIIDAVKQSAAWQQGFLGLGIGTRELVPFGKIREIVVEEAGRAQGQRPIEELAQWDIVLVKNNGRRLDIGSVVLPRFLEAEARGRAWEVGQAIARLVDRPLVVSRPQRRRRPRRARQAVGVAGDRGGEEP